jgi:aspergillopepsin I
MRPSPRVYDPAGSGATRLNGHAWQIRYGDMSGAQGQVYMDRVRVGGLTVPRQAVEAAVTVSNTFIRDNHNDGLLGLAFSKLNTVKPQAQKTWFENVLPQLAQPVFTAALKRRATGTYDFGFIDRGKFVGELVWVPVKGTKGFWDFETTGYSIGGAPEVKFNITGIVDTGTSLWYLPTDLADAYWKTVPGSEWDTVQQGWVYPCKNALPDISLTVGGRMITVPGINMNYQSLSILTCFGGIQRADRMPFSIFGDVFLKGLFAAFEHPRNGTGQARIGFAHMPRTNDVLLPGATNQPAGGASEANGDTGPPPPPPADSDDDDDDDNDSQRMSGAGPRIPAVGGQRPAGGRLPVWSTPTSGGRTPPAGWRVGAAG